MEAVDPTQYRHYLPYLQAIAKRHPALRHQPITLNRWAKRLGYRSGSLLTMVLSGNRLPSNEMVQRLGRDLSHTEKQRRYFELLVRLERLRNKGESIKLVLEELDQLRPANTPIFELRAELFQWIYEWHHFVICELVESPDFVEDPKWIRAQLRNKITTRDIRRAIETLLRVGLLARDEKGHLHTVHESARFPPGKGNPQMRHHLRQMLERSIEALEEQPCGTREFDVTTFRMKTAQLGAIKKELRDFRSRLMSQFHDPNANVVWQFNFSVFQHTNYKIKTELKPK